MTPSSDHAHWMHRCLELAQQAAGQTAPNPLVGSVILQGQEVIGEGFHPGAGQPHAEVFALRMAGDRAQGATLYVNLEPCNHYGRTPPCTEAIIAAGIRRVVVGMIDPDPRVSGSGVQRLQEAGIEVITGIEAAACERLNEAFSHRVIHHRPFGILKYAMTLDGKIATSSGHSAWVTGTKARARVHQLRSICDAVIVGGNTVRRDNPRLTTHGQSHHNPLRVVMSRQLHLPEEAHLWDTQTAATLVFTETAAPADRQVHLRAQGVDVIPLDSLTPANVMAVLGDRGCLSVLWECGGTLAARAIADGMIQKVWAFIAPKIIGGKTAPSPVGDLCLEQMTDAIDLEITSMQSIGADILVEGYLGPQPALKTPPKPPDRDES